MVKVIVYSTPFCPYCIALKQFLNEQNISFKDIDVSRDEKGLEEMIKKTGQLGVPVIEIDEEVIIGFDREKIVKALKINN